MQNLNMPVRCSSRRPKHASGSTFCSQGSWLSPSRHHGLSVVLCSWGLCRPRLASLGETCAQSEVGPRSFMSMSRDPGPAPAQTLCAHWNTLIGKTPKSWYFSEFAAFWSLQWYWNDTWCSNSSFYPRISQAFPVTSEGTAPEGSTGSHTTALATCPCFGKGNAIGTCFSHLSMQKFLVFLFFSLLPSKEVSLP